MIETPIPQAEGRTVLLGVGGTIAGVATSRHDHVGYRAGALSPVDLLQGLDWPSDAPLTVESLASIDSKDIDIGVWRRLLQRLDDCLRDPTVRSVVVTHGTDTLEETAFLVQEVLNPQKPVVFTCAMRPASALSPDGPQNLQDALSLSRHPGWQGTVVVCAGRIHAATEVQKVHTYRLDPFDSGEAGGVGVIESGQCRFWRPVPAASQAHDPDVLAHLLSQDWPRVEWVVSHGGADGAMVRALLQAAVHPPLAGILVAGTGNGTVHQGLQQVLHEADAQGVRVRRVSRCAEGGVVPPPAGEAGHGWPFLPWPAAKARLALVLELVRHTTANSVAG